MFEIEEQISIAIKVVGVVWETFCLTKKVVRDVVYIPVALE